MNNQLGFKTSADRVSVERFLRGFMAKALPSAPGEEDIHVPFLEMGANSLALMEVQRALESRYGLTIAITQFFQELTTMDELANYIVQHQAPPPPAAAPVPLRRDCGGFGIHSDGSSPLTQTKNCHIIMFLNKKTATCQNYCLPT